MIKIGRGAAIGTIFVDAFKQVIIGFVLLPVSNIHFSVSKILMIIFFITSIQASHIYNNTLGMFILITLVDRTFFIMRKYIGATSVT